MLNYGKLKPINNENVTISKMKQTLESLNKRFAYVKNSVLLIIATLLDLDLK